MRLPPRSSCAATAARSAANESASTSIERVSTRRIRPISMRRAYERRRTALRQMMAYPPGTVTSTTRSFHPFATVAIRSTVPSFQCTHAHTGTPGYAHCIRSGPHASAGTSTGRRPPLDHRSCARSESRSPYLLFDPTRQGSPPRPMAPGYAATTDITTRVRSPAPSVPREKESVPRTPREAW